MKTQAEFEKYAADIMANARKRVARAQAKRAEAQHRGMHLYRLERTDNVKYDEARSMLVRARNKHEARSIAAWSRRTGDEGPEVWLGKSTVVERVPLEGPTGVILIDVLEG